MSGLEHAGFLEAVRLSLLSVAVGALEVWSDEGIVIEFVKYREVRRLEKWASNGQY